MGESCRRAATLAGWIGASADFEVTDVEQGRAFRLRVSEAGGAVVGTCVSRAAGSPGRLAADEGVDKHGPG
ncbi:MAG: hypothetical protein JW741_22060 [Sedimentisphaerales bacterium]|nr:hypothetical protein [Sedimentisphaerales bacterium]